MLSPLIADIESFARLFKGREDAYGTGKGSWVKRPPTLEDFARHLCGEGTGLGIAPLMDDGTVKFAAIDLDEPDFEAAREMQKLMEFGTTWIERSRSGNAHLWAFFSSPIEAWIVRGIMREVTRAIDKPTIEIFPKQDKLRDGMLGNYVNLPYHGDSRPVLMWNEGPNYSPLRWDHREMPLNSFLAQADGSLNDPEKWRTRARWLMLTPPEQRITERAEFGTQRDLHMCAEYILGQRDENPILEGHRNIAYFNLSKMFSHYEGFDHDDALTMLKLIRDSADEQGVDHVRDSELEHILANAERGGFTSTGCDDPIMLSYTHPDCPIAAKARG